MTTQTRSNPGAAVGLVSALLLGSVFVFSAWTKVLSPKAFVAAIDSYGIFPSDLALALATGVVGLEFALGVMLILGIQRRTAAWLSLPLLVMFVGLLLYAMQAGIEECGCFGEVIKLEPKVELMLDIGLLGLLALILWKGRDLKLGSPAFRTGFGFAALCAGALVFLAAGPGGALEETLEVTTEDLAILSEAEPPIHALPDEAFLFFFSADCPHCWSYSGAVDLMATRLEGIEVIGVTLSDPYTVEQFQTDFSPRYPIHYARESVFHSITEDYPAGIWITQGSVEEAWNGYIPSHREVSEAGGYLIVEPTEAAAPQPEIPEAPEASASPFGGPIKSRN